MVEPWLERFQIRRKPVINPSASFFHVLGATGIGEPKMVASQFLVEIYARCAGDIRFSQ